MSVYTTFKTYEELIKYLNTVNDPQCCTFNYLPDRGEYALWIGNQPYYVYEKWIGELETDITELKKENKKLEETVSTLRWRMLSKIFKINKLEKKIKRGE